MQKTGRRPILPLIYLIIKCNEPRFLKNYFDIINTGRLPGAFTELSQGLDHNPCVVLSQYAPANLYQEITPPPTLLIAGENVHFRYMSEAIYKAAAVPKALVIIPGAVYVDLYDKVDLI